MLSNSSVSESLCDISDAYIYLFGLHDFCQLLNVIRHNLSLIIVKSTHIFNYHLA